MLLIKLIMQWESYVCLLVVRMCYCMYGMPYALQTAVSLFFIIYYCPVIIHLFLLFHLMIMILGNERKQFGLC